MWLGGILIYVDLAIFIVMKGLYQWGLVHRLEELGSSTHLSTLNAYNYSSHPCFLLAETHAAHDLQVCVRNQVFVGVI